MTILLLDSRSLQPFSIHAIEVKVPGTKWLAIPYLFFFISNIRTWRCFFVNAKGCFVIDSLDNGVWNLVGIGKMLSSSASVMCPNHAIPIPANLWLSHSLTYPVSNAIATCTQRPKNKIKQKQKNEKKNNEIFIRASAATGYSLLITICEIKS